MEKIVRYSIVAAMLMAGAGIFYRYVIFLPEVERQKAEIAAQKKQNYDACNIGARNNYDTNWAAACKSNAQFQSTQLKNCLTDPAVITNQFLGASYCHRTFGGRDSSPKCALPKVLADSINLNYKENQEKCVTEAKLGL
jgi:hypothetical protein